MYKIYIYSFCLFIIFCAAINGQNENSPANFHYDGLSLKAGYSYIAVKDEYISKEKYSGSAPAYIISWTKDHSDYKYILLFEILNSAKIQNHNISANITELVINSAYLYALGETPILNKRVLFALGPMPELYLHYRNEDIAKGGEAMFDAYSFALLLSIGAKLNALIPITGRLTLEGNLQSSLVSLGGRLKDLKDEKESFIKFTTAIRNFRAAVDVTLRYELFVKLGIAAGYKFNLTNMRSWDYFISANDNLLFSISYSF